MAYLSVYRRQLTEYVFSSRLSDLSIKYQSFEKCLILSLLHLSSDTKGRNQGLYVRNKQNSFSEFYRYVGVKSATPLRERFDDNDV